MTLAIFVSTLFIGGSPRSACAKEGRPTIERVRLAVERGYILGHLESSGLFSERITGTVQSGLPAVVDLFYYFSALDGSTVAENVLSFSLSYDVWEDIYSISGPDTILSFKTFVEMQRAIEDLHKLKLISFDSLDPDRSYRLHVSITITPLQGAERAKITGWIDENMRASKDNSWHGHVLNLNELISHFFSRDHGIVSQTNWYKSAFIKPDSLYKMNQEKE